jgi:hypothetical protein
LQIEKQIFAGNFAHRIRKEIPPAALLSPPIRYMGAKDDEDDYQRHRRGATGILDVIAAAKTLAERGHRVYAP